MANATKNDARCDFRISSQAKALIEQAAGLNGQTLTEFAVAALVEKARQVLHAESVRALSERDARQFMRLLDEEEPNAALARPPGSTRKPMPTWRIERLSDAHDRTAFHCGKPSLDDFLKRLAGQYERRDFAAVYVATSPPAATVLGYYTLSSGLVDLEALPEAERKKLPHHPVPVIHLGRLAVDQNARGQGLGRHLLLDALRVGAELSTKVAVHAVEVRAIDDEARRFYQKYGFQPLLDDALHLYLSMKVVRRLKLSP